MWLVIILVFVAVIVFAVIYYCACRNTTEDKKTETYSAAATATPKSKDNDDVVNKTASMSEFADEEVYTSQVPYLLKNSKIQGVSGLKEDPQNEAL